MEFGYRLIPMVWLWWCRCHFSTQYSKHYSVSLGSVSTRSPVPCLIWSGLCYGSPSVLIRVPLLTRVEKLFCTSHPIKTLRHTASTFVQGHYSSSYSYLTSMCEYVESGAQSRLRLVAETPNILVVLFNVTATKKSISLQSSPRTGRHHSTVHAKRCATHHPLDSNSKSRNQASLLARQLAI